MKERSSCFWEPRPDISVYELALCLGPMLCAVAGNLDGVDAAYEALPPSAKRHFRRQDNPASDGEAK